MVVCIRKSRRRLKAIAATVIFLLSILFVMRQLEKESIQSSGPVSASKDRRRRSIINISCTLPKLDPFNDDVMKLVRKLPPLKCSGKKRYGTVVGQTLQLDVTSVIKAELKYIRRPKGDDFNIKYSEAIPLDITRTDADKVVITIKPTEDFIKLFITNTSGIVETKLHSIAIAKDEALDGAQPMPKDFDDLGLSIAFVMLESLSAASFTRAMPESQAFLNKQRDTIFFKGHTIVGDGTTDQISAMFTGFNEQDLPEARRSFPNSKPVDRWPFIFKDFKRKGYVTMFQEDESTFATFNYRLHGFKIPPTDHYARPFYIAANSEPNPYDFTCCGSWPVHKHVLSYATSFFDTYSTRKKLSLTMIACLLHHSVNEGQLVDGDLAHFMRELQAKGHLNNTILVLFGDHGARFSKVRWKLVGKLEERMPFLSVKLPHWFKHKHENLYNAMVENAKILTSHFDIYGTLRHMLDFPKFERVGIGRSLFTLIDPITRSCQDAGIADHWCPCLNYVNVSVQDLVVQRASESAVTFINQLLGANNVAKDRCATLSLKEIIRAGKVIHNWQMEDFVETRKSSRCDSCVILFKKNKQIKTVKYELVLKVSPSNGEYEVSVKIKGDEIDVDPHISRINMYGNQPECIAETHPHLRNYCFCK